ncbi:unnamed protein product [Rotaria sordida]|uniref:Uncharacterized protein n=1 Tax=Rotaria sordida TaxID=392033 RepID=A0A815B4S6_9BILA|nr:unnamed protein product [Rotaria sordida]
MYKKFRCGRLILMHDGTLKKLDLENGGGARVCHWNNKDMTLNDIHHVILNIFNMADTQLETSLYDFKLNRLDVNQYATFYDYIYHNGLNCNSTVIYLCTNQVNNIDESKTKEKEHTTTTSTSKKISKQSTISLSTTSVECKNIIDNIEQDSDECNSHNTSSEYSFVNSINKLLKNIRELINQNNYDENLIQLFENISMIYGYVYLTIDSLQEYIQSLNEDVRLNRKYNITLHSTCLNNIIDICESTEILFNLNNNKFRYIEHYSIISDSFIQFYQNLKATQRMVSSFIPPTCSQILINQNNIQSQYISSKGLSGRILPAGTFSDPIAALEYIYGVVCPIPNLPPRPSTIQTIKLVRITYDKDYLITDNEIEVTVTGNKRLTFFVRMAFDKDYKLCAYDGQIRNFGLTFDPSTDTERQATINFICNFTQTFCQGKLQQYSSVNDCKKFLTTSIPYGSLDRGDQGNVACRTIHAYFVPLLPTMHCAHVGPTGGGACTNKPIDFYYNQTNFLGCAYKQY